ncbi:uncharacterized protein LOC134194086 [Corticium candelabrum]|uniref:uncharacterized protein LOC134194086 n=1 Tax=Corticium candelabrum TaxID=121492 RepID=UPI002E26E53C|nr:uncharacterized protein LOC134194086 [Corticium candelabrum]
MRILVSRLLNNANSKPFLTLITATVNQAESNLRDKARLNSVSARHSRAWLMAISNQKLGLFMSPQKFMIALRMRLGIPVFPSSLSIVRCSCSAVIDPHRDQVLGCGHGSLRNKRHDTLCDVIFNTVLVDNRDCKKEQRCNSHNNARPGDVFHPDVLQGRAAYFDVSVRNSLQASYLQAVVFIRAVADHQAQLQVTITSAIREAIIAGGGALLGAFVGGPLAWLLEQLWAV